MTNSLGQNGLILLVASFLLLHAMAGLRTSKTILVYKEYEKSEKPLGYWITILLSAAISAALFILAIIRILLRN